MTRMTAIKTFFEANGGRLVEKRELIALSPAEREELAGMAATTMGVELDPSPTVTP